MNYTKNLKLPIFNDPENDKFKIDIWNEGNQNIENSVNKINTDNTNINNAFQKLDIDNSIIKEQLENMKTKTIPVINEKINTNKTDIITANEKINTNKTDILAANEKINTNKINIGDLGSLTTANKNNLVIAVNEVSTKIEALSPETNMNLIDEITAARQGKTKLVDNIQEIKSNITTNTNNINTLNSKVSTAEGNISTLNSKATTAEENINILIKYVFTVDEKIGEVKKNVILNTDKIKILEEKNNTYDNRYAAKIHEHYGLYAAINLDFPGNFNNALTQGEYGFSGINIPGAPIQGEIYGKLKCMVSRGPVHNNFDNWIWQEVYLTDRNTAFRRRKINNENWTNWREY